MSAQHDADVLPLRPAGRETATPTRTTPAGPPAREKTIDGLGLWLKIQSAFAGASLLDATPPALLLIWERHMTAARAWDSWLLRWPRFAWGAVHAAIVAPLLYFLVWATDSGPKATAALVVIITTLAWLPHITITITL